MSGHKVPDTLPCPHCRELPRFVRGQLTKKCIRWSVSCKRCGTSGPVVQSRTGAAEEWNILAGRART
jgi:transcription elongation factor Elf1